MRKKFKLINILIIILLGISIYFGTKAFYEYRNLDKANSLYQKMLEHVEYNRKQFENEYVEIEGLPLAEYLDFYEMNHDFYGWIKIDGTNIDYPVMHTVDEPEKYLRKDFNGDYSIPGTIFLDYRDTASSDNLIVYGHYMQNGTMFGDLFKYKDEDFLKQHQIIEFDNLYEKKRYEIFAVFYDYVREVSDNSFKYYNLIDIAEEDFDDVVATLKSKSIVDVDIDIKYGEQLLMLSTCSYHKEDGRFVVVAREIKS